MKKILLVKTISKYCYTIAPNLGLGYLAASLRKAGHIVSILDCDKERMSLAGFDAYIKSANFDVVGFQLYTNGLFTAKAQAEIVRLRLRDALIVIGGPHVSGDPEHAMKYMVPADIAIAGEGEEAIVEVAKLSRSQVIDPSFDTGINNVIYRLDNGKLRINPLKYIEDLDSLPLPAWDLIDPRNYPVAPHGTFARAYPIAPIITSRGCPYMCTFCASFMAHGKRIRRRSPEAVIDEIEYLNREFAVKEFHIEDDNFTMSKEYAKAVLNGIIARRLKIWIALPNGARLDSLDMDMLKIMERAGCYSFGVGIESGSNRMLKIMKKELNTKAIKDKIDFINKNTKMRVTGFFLIGHPQETETDILRTMAFACKIKLDRVSFSPLMPLPGSEIYSEWKRRVNFEEVDWDKFLYYQFIPSVSSISKKRLERLLRSANMRFYMRPHIIIGLLKEIKTPHQFRMLFKRARTIVAR